MADTKQRHGCLVAWLVILIIGYSLLISLYATTAVLLRNTRNVMPLHLAIVYCGMAAVNVLCAIGVLRWRMIAFYGMVAINLLAALLNLAGGRLLFAAMCLVPPLVLYLVLHIGDDNQGWHQLE